MKSCPRVFPFETSGKMLKMCIKKLNSLFSRTLSNLSCCNKCIRINRVNIRGPVHSCVIRERNPKDIQLKFSIEGP